MMMRRVIGIVPILERTFLGSKLSRYGRQGLKSSFTSYAQLGSTSSRTVDLSYASYEAESGSNEPPVIVMHGMMGSKQNWHSLSKVMANMGRNIFCVDARNHGDSPHTESMDYFLMTEDVLRLMDKLKIEKAVLLGHSMGGKAFMTTALTNPDRVSGLIVVDVSPSVSPNIKTYPAHLMCMLKIHLQVYDEDPNISLAMARKEADEKLASVEPHAVIRQFLVQNLIFKDGKIKWRVNLDSIINNFPVLASFPEFFSERYDGPSLFIGGRNSPYISIANLPDIEWMFPDSRVQFIEGAGHWVHSEKPSAFLALVKDFLKTPHL